MGVNAPFGFRPVNQGSNPPIVEEGLTISNLTVLEGDALVLRASGYLAHAGATSTALYGFAAHGVTGVAATRQRINFYPAMPGVLFEAQAAGPAAINRTEAYAVAGVSVGTAGTTPFVVKAGGTSSVLQLVGPHPNSALDATYPILRCRVSKSSYLGNP